MPTPKSIAEVIAAAIPALGDVRDTLIAAKDALLAKADEFPDAKPAITEAVSEIDAKLAILDGATSGEALRALGVTVMNELAALPSTGLQPLFHSGSVTGG